METTEEDVEGMQEVTSSLAAAEEITVDVAVAAILSRFGGIFTIKGEETTALKAFISERGVFSLILTDFGNRFVKHLGAYVAPHTNGKP